MWLLNNLKTIGAVGATLVIVYFLHNWDVNRLEAKHLREMQEQATFLQNDCKKQQEITEGVSRETSQKLNTLNSELNRLKRLYNTKNNGLPTSQPSSGSNGAKAGEYVGQDSCPVESLLDLGGQCEAIRIQLGSCQDFIKQTWALREQN